ncbi:hypothetical protein TNIN_492061 [Trichonephila inaurata madagascariensis]|uniref:Uncharacterized protein n=1 Tax=Trichonephila inaurata madagascariensis TaxID=2747483 RepID=A0A8X6YWN3_9ARAC|nr:hypothetical protein TNIN_492061 [Trichonephila inaurata madagascariensis]
MRVAKYAITNWASSEDFEAYLHTIEAKWSSPFVDEFAVNAASTPLSTDDRSVFPENDNRDSFESGEICVQLSVLFICTFY